MNKQKVSAFTRKANGRKNVLNSDVKVSAHKKLFPQASQRKFSAIWDTGATNTAISKKVVQECNLIPIGQANSNTANGTCVVNTYLIDLYLPNDVAICGVIATEFTSVGDSDLLIGMDIMSLGDFAISNYQGKTSFSFRVPSIAEIDFVKQLNNANPRKREEEKVGRNDPCPCGSAKKYKKCCGRTK